MSASNLLPIAAWFLLGMTRIVVTSKLAEHRIDKPDPAQALAINRSARTARLNVANYDPRGQRLLPCYRFVNASYWTVAACVFVWAVTSA
jgi:hypothetical protein